LDRHLISDIANQHFYALREHARGRSIKRERTDMETHLIQSVNNPRSNRARRSGNKNECIDI